MTELTNPAAPDLTGTRYEKDDDGRVWIGFGGDIMASEKSHERNRKSRAFLKDGDRVEFLLRVNGDIVKVQCAGVVSVEPGKMYSAVMRSRIEQNVAEPVEPTGPDDPAEVL